MGETAIQSSYRFLALSFAIVFTVIVGKESANGDGISQVTSRPSATKPNVVKLPTIIAEIPAIEVSDGTPVGKIEADPLPILSYSDFTKPENLKIVGPFEMNDLRAKDDGSTLEIGALRQTFAGDPYLPIATICIGDDGLTWTWKNEFPQAKTASQAHLWLKFCALMPQIKGESQALIQFVKPEDRNLSFSVAKPLKLSFELEQRRVELCPPGRLAGGWDIVDATPTSFTIQSGQDKVARFKISFDRTTGFVTSSWNLAHHTCANFASSATANINTLENQQVSLRQTVSQRSINLNNTGSSIERKMAQDAYDDAVQEANAIPGEIEADRQKAELWNTRAGLLDSPPPVDFTLKVSANGVVLFRIHSEKNGPQDQDGPTSQPANPLKVEGGASKVSVK